MFGISNNAMEQILLLICLVLPKGHCVPNTMDKIWNIVRGLASAMKMIHACFNDCVLFHGEYENLEKCPICEDSRWEHTNSEGLMMWKMTLVELKRRFLVKFLGISHLFSGAKIIYERHDIGIYVLAQRRIG